MKSQSRVISDPNILGGKLIIKGTRISVEFILELVASGMSVHDILQEYDHLKPLDIQAALSSAQKAVAKEYIIPRQRVALAH